MNGLRTYPQKRNTMPSRWSLAERVAHLSDKTGGFDACWPWKGSHNHLGYGRFQFRKRFYMAHRAAWEVAFGPIPVGQVICHACDNPKCVNPKHLFMGTTLDNVADKIAKGRQRYAVGEAYARTKLTADLVRQIRDSDPAISHGAIGRRLGVSAGCVSHVRRRTTWKHIP